MGVGKLHFWGEHNRPLSPEERTHRLPVPASTEIPSDLEASMAEYRIYVSTPGKEQRPAVDTLVHNHLGSRSIWELSITQSENQQLVHLPIESIVREDPELIRSAIDPAADFTGFCPDWSHLFYLPRTLPSTSETHLTRFNGQRVEPAYVFGADNRQVYRDTSFPWRCVGKVFNSDGKVGSGALVGSNVMVTAGHMIPWNGANGGGWIRFVPDYFDTQSLLGSGVQSYVSDVRGYSDSYYSGQPSGYDWAICKLNNPLGNSVGYFGFNGYDSNWEDLNVWDVAGYPTAVAGGNRPSWQGGIAILDDDSDSNDGDELESNNADITGGNSGGPIFAWFNKDPRVIGVVSGWASEYIFPKGTEDDNIFASGSGFTNLIAWGRSNW